MPSRTRTLLERWHGGEENALEELLEAHLPWLRAQVRRRVGARLRRKADTTDFVQDAAVEFLRYGPQIVVSDENRFRGLLACIVENVIRERHDWFSARRRAIDRERPLLPDSVLDLDAPVAQTESPSEVMARKESAAWVRLAVRLLPPEDQELIYLRQWDGLPYAELAEKLDISEDAARMRFNRAVRRLTGTAALLRRGQLDEAIADEPE